MSDIEQLLSLITNILQATDTNLRKQSEDILKNIQAQKPNQLIATYLDIIVGNHSVLHKNFSASQLRLNLSNFAPATYTNLWQKLIPEVKEQVKNKLFLAIYQQADLTMKKHIADTLGEVAGSIIQKNQKEWQDFKITIWKLFQDSNIGSVFAGFYILESFLAFSPEYFADSTNQLFVLFKTGLEHANQKLKLSCLRCFAAYLQILEIKQHSAFQPLVIPIFEAVYVLLSQFNDEEGLECLSEMLQIQTKFFKKNFKQLVDLQTKIFQLPKIESGVKRMATQLLVDLAQRSPALFRKRKQALQSTIEMIFFHMIQISEEITQQWKNPPEGYNEDMEDDEDFETTRFGMGAIDRLIYTIGQSQLLPILSATIQKLLSNNDWRYKYTAVMALSQIGEYIEDVQKISSVLQMILGFLKHQNPMLRYASCHAIGQISDDMQPQFQKKYGNAVFPELLSLLQSDPVPRVVSHSAAALTNFLQGMTWQQIQAHHELLVNLLQHIILNGNSLSKESALSALSSTVEVSKTYFQPFLIKTMQILFGFYTHQIFNAKQYKHLKGQTIETITIIASSVGAQMFRPYVNIVIELLIRLQNSQFQQTDPQKTYIMAGWQRLCLVYGKQLGAYLSNILPGLFVLVENVIKLQIDSLNSDAEPDDKNINTYETEEAQVAISMLNIFIQQLKQLYNPYVEKTITLLCTIIKQHPNGDVKQQACKCLPNLINAVKIENQPLAIHLSKLFMGTLVETMEKQFDSEIIIVELQTLKSILDQLGLCFLNQTQVSDFSQKMLKLLNDSDQKKNQSRQGIQELDEEQKQIVDEEIKMEEEVQVAISQLIGTLFKTHKQMTISFANFLISNVLPKVFVDNQRQTMLKFGIFLIDDIVEFLGYEATQVHWGSFSNVLCKYTSQKSCVLRQAACYGLGIFAQKTPSSILNADTINLWLNYLYEAVKIQKGSEKQKTYGSCRDNAVAAIGKIIKTHHTVFDPQPAITFWIHFNPLRHDKEEGFVQSELIIDILSHNPNWILGQNQLQGLQKVLGIYADVAGNKKLYNQHLGNKLKEHLKQLITTPLFTNNVQAIMSSLSQKQKESLTAFVK